MATLSSKMPPSVNLVWAGGDAKPGLIPYLGYPFRCAKGPAVVDLLMPVGSERYKGGSAKFKAKVASNVPQEIMSFTMRRNWQRSSFKGHTRTPSINGC